MFSAATQTFEAHSVEVGERERESGTLSDAEEILSDVLADDVLEPPLRLRAEFAHAQADDSFCQKLRRYMRLAEEERPMLHKKLQPSEDHRLFCVRFRERKPVFFACKLEA